MRFMLPFLGKTKKGYLDEGIRDYADRLSHFAQVETPVLKEKAAGKTPDDKIKLLEAEQLLGKIDQCKQGIVIALDPYGKMVDSEGLATLLGRWQDRGVDTAAFLIGGHLGLHQSVLTRADHVLSLSKMTFTHEMTRMLLLEQLYRACTIQAGHKYHK
ncbi:23S rRNA (pseudouridine(1915)-N(3))-methyltransferase RlmH [Desulfogranum marinum]|uniref:23S rRNA (pseudouridine(1915)-N(3))-methyltransferase RlmH n=1 Tax=Desulfogranum marinum TaxID=453220 RepID=UPI0029C84690|nr:23S rRNA (pseudouridine(1915)-N(3))-methyltransferase RlmH [Desulfogranum marinum]